MVRGQQSHLACEIEVEMDYASARANACSVIDVTIRRHIAPRMTAVQFFECFVHARTASKKPHFLVIG
jgi:hypothetical protein